MANRRGGFSLVELLIAMALGGFIVGALVSTIISTRQSASLNRALAEVQESARFALEFLKRDLRMAGNWGCADPDLSLLAVSVNGASLDYFKNPIYGYEGDQGEEVFPEEIKNKIFKETVSGKIPDAFTVRYADENNRALISVHNPTSAVITTKSNHKFKEGDILIVTDCSHVGIFQATPGTKRNKINHNSGKAVSPGNCTKAIKAVSSNWDCNNNPPHQEDIAHNKNSYQYKKGSEVLYFVNYTYYIGKNASKEPELRRYNLSKNKSESLVEGIEEMQLCYLENGSWKMAHQVGDWKKVSSVRLTVVARSLEKNASFVAHKYKIDSDCDGRMEEITSSDGRLRESFTTFVKLRNVHI